MECRIAAAVTNTSDCGCDTELAQSFSTDDAHSTPLHQHHLKNYTEEFFHHTHTDIDLFQIVTVLQFAPEKKQSEREMAYDRFQPPRIQA